MHVWSCLSFIIKSQFIVNIGVQMIGSAAEVARFGVTMIVFRFAKNIHESVLDLVLQQCSFLKISSFLHHILRPEDGPEGKYSQR